MFIFKKLSILLYSVHCTLLKSYDVLMLPWWQISQ